MRRFASSLALVLAGAVLVACGSSTTSPASPPGTSAIASPAGGPALSPSAEAAVLLRGMRTDLNDRCVPLADGLPAAAVAGVACTPAGAAVDSASVFLFDTQEAMLGAYATWLAGHELSILDRSPGCGPDSVAESAWLPSVEGDTLPQRGACQVGVDGRARGAITLPPFVLVTYEGAATDPTAVAQWAWLGNRDQPGSPTVWSADGPMSPEK
jgi:hypothetical protein